MSHSDQGIVSPINKIEWLWDLCGGSKPPPYEVNLTVSMSLGTSRFVYVLNNKLFTSMYAKGEIEGTMKNVMCERIVPSIRH